jgi:hypothetical protein
MGESAINVPEVFAIVAAVKDAYRSLEDPDFTFVGKAIERQGYARLLDELAQSFAVRETTDENDDVAFVCLVSSETEDLGLWLSMVGPYALIQRVGENHVETLRAPYSDAETDVLALLSEHHVILVRDEVLRHRIRMALPEAEGGTVTLYQALFDNSQALPWGEQDWNEENGND